MEDLHELIQMLPPNRLADLQLPGRSGDEQLDLFCHLLADDVIKNDKEAIFAIYGKKKTPSDYPALKARLHGLYMNAFVLMDANVAINNKPELSYEEITMHLGAVFAILSRRLNGTTLDMLNGLLERAVQYGFSSTAIQVAKYQTKRYATFTPDTRMYEYCTAVCANQYELLKAEAIAEVRYQEVYLMAVDAAIHPSDLHQKGELYFLELAPLLKQFDHYGIHRHIRFIQVIYLLAKEAYSDAMEAAELAIKHFNQLPFDLTSSINAFRQIQIGCSIQFKDWSTGRGIVLDSLADLDEKEHSTYLKVQESHVLLALHCGQYQAAFDVFLEVKQKLVITSNSIWLVLQAFLQCLIAIPHIASEVAPQAILEMEQLRFPKSMPEHNPKRDGREVSLLLAQTLHFLLTGRYDQAAARIHALSDYSNNNYLRKDAFLRSNCLIAMMQELTNASFHKAAVQRHAEKHWSKLINEPIRTVHQHDEPEFLPYEQFWALVLEALPLKRIKWTLKKNPRTS